MNRICVVCGASFEAKTNRAKYCCTKCKNHSRFGKECKTFEEIRQENEVLKLKIIKLNKAGKTDKEIAEKIGKSTSWVRQRRVEMGVPRKGLRKSKEKIAHKLEIAQMEFRFCKLCGAYFYPKSANQLFCSKSCMRRSGHQVNDIKRKRLEQARKVDDIALDDVYKKYNGICYLCGGKCDYNAVRIVHGVRHSLRDYPSREHIIPLSKGGLHTWDNIRLAHVGCNSRKGVRYG